MKSVYRFAIIGCGQIAARHATQIAKHGQLVAVCDIINEKANTLAAGYGAKAYNSINELLEKEKGIDVAVICTPNGLHAPHSIIALQHGCHVLCEKPMAISCTDSQAMIDAEKKSGKRLFVVKQNRFNPPIAFVKQLLDNNKLGKVLSFQLNCFWNRPAEYYQNSWRGSLSLDGGTLYTQFSHFIDLLYWLLGDVAQTSGIRSNKMHGSSIEFEDTGAAWLKMTSGVIGSLNYTINSHHKNMEGSLTLFGESGTVKIGGQYLNELEYFSVEGESQPSLPTSQPPNKYGFYEGSMSNHDKVYEHLVQALDNPSYSFINSAETLKTIEIIEAIYRASPLI